MRTLEFNDENIRVKFKNIERLYPAITSVIYTLGDNSIIMDIITDNNIQIIVSNNGLINVYIDLLSKKIKVIDSKKQYTIVYDNYPKKHFIPIAYEYQNDSCLLIKKNNVSLSDDKCYYDLIVNDNMYTIIISKDNLFNEDTFIKYLLNQKNIINNIRDLFKLLIIYNNKMCFKVADTKGSVIVINKGILEKYIEYINDNNNYSKIYLENNEFYIERKVKEKYDDKDIALIKKIGESNGKER